MKNQKSVNAKAAKKRAQHKAYAKTKHIVQNKARPVYNEEKARVLPVLDDKGRIKFEDGKAVYKVDGARNVRVKGGRKVLKAGDGILPKSKKVKESKKKVARAKVARTRALTDRDATGN